MAHCKKLFDYQDESRGRIERVGAHAAEVLRHLVIAKGQGQKLESKGLSLAEPFCLIVECLCLLLGDKNYLLTALVITYVL